MRQDTLIWTPHRASLKDIEATLAEHLECAPIRDSAVITPLFHATPNFNHAQVIPERLRLITLENGDYQKINNPRDENLDEIFAEWPRIILYFRMPATAGADTDVERRIVLECHDLETNWDKAGWTSGTTYIHQGEGKDRHKIILGLAPWGWRSQAELEKALEKASWGLARLMNGTWAFYDDAAGGATQTIERFFKERKDKNTAGDPLESIRNFGEDESTFYGF